MRCCEPRLRIAENPAPTPVGVVATHSVEKDNSGGSVSLSLDAALIVQTITLLRDRIRERFPDSGLARVADQFVEIAQRSTERVRSVAEPHIPLRAAIAFLIGLILAITGSLLFLFARLPSGLTSLASLLQVVEALIVNTVYISAAVFFLGTVEARIKRRRALRFLRELRALAHIVDMHQLTKDPDRLSATGSDTPSSPHRTMTRFELGRYLDYCSEMLSMISKIAALYVQNYDDPVVLAAVDEVETLTTGFARKIWQKIMILERPSGPQV